jgi:transposase
MVNVKEAATPRTATSIWPGLSWRRPTLPSALVRESRVFIRAKKSKSNAIVAIKAVAHKLCRACYYIMKDQVPFDITKAFA